MPQPRTEIPEGVERFAVGSDPEHPGFSEMHPDPLGPWIHIDQLNALHAHWVEQLLSNEAVEAHARKPSDIAGSDDVWDELDDEDKEICRAESRQMLQAALSASLEQGEGK